MLEDLLLAQKFAFGSAKLSVYIQRSAIYINDITRSSTKPRFYALNSDKGQIQEFKKYGIHSDET